jgi:ABC-type antimicrobial peptide transport system permease subunit
VLGAFAAFALLLSAMGLYAVIAYAVAQRGREIGIRLALGAAPRRIFRMVLGDGLRQMLLGLTVGLAGAVAAGRVLASRLFHLGAADPFTLAAVVGLLVAVGLLACCVPARRAARLDPMVVMRTE